MEKNNQSVQKNSEEIELKDILAPLWDRRWFIARVSLAFGLIGLLWILIRPPEYTASITFIPQTTDKTGAIGNLGGLAAIAGINLQGLGSGSEIPPSIYPKIISSSVFRRELLAAPLSNDDGKIITYFDYFGTQAPLNIPGLLIKYTIGLPGQLSKMLKSSDSVSANPKLKSEIIQVTEKEDEHFRRLERQIIVAVDKKENSVQMSFTMPDAKMAAQMTQISYELLQRELIQYKIELARQQLQFIERQYEQKKQAFESAQSRLSEFRDQNQNLSTARATSRQEELESEFNLAFTIYSEMAKQLEQAKIQVSKDTPIFSVIQPVAVPLLKSTVSKTKLLLISLFLGMLSGITWIFAGRLKIQKSNSNS